MRVKYYKSLDRELMLFGIRGRWLWVFGIGIAAVLLLCVIFGMIYDTGVAMGLFIAGFAVDFLACVIIQARIPSRRLQKLLYVKMLPCRIVRHESLYRILRQKITDSGASAEGDGS